MPSTYTTLVRVASGGLLSAVSNAVAVMASPLTSSHSPQVVGLRRSRRRRPAAEARRSRRASGPGWNDPTRAPRSSASGLQLEEGLLLALDDEHADVLSSQVARLG